MQLILAIVADQQQAAQLAALIDGRLAVDLVQAAEVGEGLLALDDRIPDLILTSPLMSPFDDGVLDEYLRDLGPAGAHVQSLRIPVLSQAPKKAPRLGFSLRRRPKPVASTLDGCEPKVFADEIAQYLARAAEEKRHASATDTTPVIARHAVHEEAVPTPISEEAWTPAYEAYAVADTAVVVGKEPEPEMNGWRSDLLDRPPADDTWEQSAREVEAEQPASVDAAAADAESFEDQMAPNEMLVEAADQTTIAQPSVVEEAPVADRAPVAATEEPPIVTATAREDVEAAAVEPTIVDRAMVTPPTVARPVPAPSVPVVADDPHSKATPSFKAALAAIRAAWGKPSSPGRMPAPEQAGNPAARQEPVEAVTDDATPLEVDLTGEVELLDESAAHIDPPAPEPARPFVSAGSPETPDVYELSVEADMEELESVVSAPSSPESSGDRRKKPAKRPNKAAKAKSPRQSPPQAAQDEWGIFDPNRCGFAAVVDKLDELSETKAERTRTSGKGRVISCS